MSDFKVDIKLVKKIRENTGSGFLDVQNALKEAKNDYDKAIQILKEAGSAKAVKKEGRIATEGLIEIQETKDLIGMIELNCETDFVSKNNTFMKLLDSITQSLFKNYSKIKEINGGKSDIVVDNVSDKTLEKIINEIKINKDDSIIGAINKAIATIGEKLTLRRVAIIQKIDNSTFGSYVHTNKRIGAIIQLDKGSQESLARDLAMQVSAMSPKFIKKSDITEEIIKEERTLASKLIEDSAKGKPEDIKNKMMEGKVNKALSSLTLLDQQFIKDTKLTIDKLLKQNGCSVLNMYRFEVGEGLAKAENKDFASEVKEQVNKAAK